MLHGENSDDSETTDNRIQWHFLQLAERREERTVLLVVAGLCFIFGGRIWGGTNWGPAEVQPLASEKSNTSSYNKVILELISVQCKSAERYPKMEKGFTEVQHTEVRMQPWPEFVNKPWEHCEIHPRAGS